MSGCAPLVGHGVLLTRPAHQVVALQQQFIALGASVACHPTLVIQPRTIQEISAVAQLAIAEWVIFTSQNAVIHMPESCRALLAERLSQRTVQIFAVGASTARLLDQYHLSVLDYPREQPGSESLFAKLMTHPLKKHVLLVGRDTARPWLAEQLRHQGMSVQSLPVYQCLPATPVSRALWQTWEKQGIDTLVFTSAEGFLNSLDWLREAKDWIAQCVVVVISARIGELVRRHTVCRALVVTSAAYDAEILDAVLDYWQANA